MDTLGGSTPSPREDVRKWEPSLRNRGRGEVWQRDERRKSGRGLREVGGDSWNRQSFEGDLTEFHRAEIRVLSKSEDFKKKEKKNNFGKRVLPVDRFKA